LALLLSELASREARSEELDVELISVEDELETAETISMSLMKGVLNLSHTL
jgi:hypothetical protein